MFKRIGLFLLTNLLVVLTVSLILNIVMPMLGIRPDGIMRLAVMCGLFGMMGAFISLAMSRWMAKSAYRIYVIQPSDQNFQYREIYNMVAKLARQANLPAVPEVGIYESAEPNAFATGPSKSKSIVAFSTGLLSSMNKQEVEAVAAHEISHIANGDMVTMTLLTGIANALVMFLSRIIASVIDSALRGDDDEGGLGFFAYIMVVMALETFFMLLASIPIAAFSRYREFKADAGAAKLTSPMDMANALKRLARAVEIPTQKDSFAIAKISSNRKVSIFSTHPSIEDRIARLTQMR
jgi:heat shock protein HtpX